MNRAIKHLVAGYVALCLAFAGAVGISPVLHQLVEHGGRGAVHAHLGQRAGINHSQASGLEAHDHGHQTGVNHNHSHAVEPPARTGLFVHSAQTFRVPQLLSLAWNLLGNFLAAESDGPPESAPASDSPSHDHHSLAQSLTSGLVEISADLPPLEGAFLVACHRSLPPDAPLLDDRWDALTASRGPPFQA